MKNLILTFVVLAVMVLTGVACAGTDASSATTWRYKMTVTVETPEGDKTGSAVREISVQQGIHLTPEMLPHVSLKGEAVVVDLGQRGVVFALLKGYYLGEDYGADITRYAFGIAGGKKHTAEDIGHIVDQDTNKMELEPKWYPVLVRFRDPKDPKTVENLLDMKPDNKIPPTFTIEKDHFEEAFGKGVKLKSVTIEMTNEPVTRGVVGKFMPSYAPQQEYLKWLRSLSYKDPRREIFLSDFGGVKQ